MTHTTRTLSYELMIKYLLCLDYAYAFNRFNCRTKIGLNAFFNEHELPLFAEKLAGHPVVDHREAHQAAINALLPLLPDKFGEAEGIATSSKCLQAYMRPWYNVKQPESASLSDAQFLALQSAFFACEQRLRERWIMVLHDNKVLPELPAHLHDAYHVLYRALNGKRATGNTRGALPPLQAFFSEEY